MDEKRGTKRQIRFVAPRPIEAVVHPPSPIGLLRKVLQQPTTNNRPPPANKVIFLSLSFRVRLWHNGIHTGFKLCTFCTNVPFIFSSFQTSQLQTSGFKPINLSTSHHPIFLSFKASQPPTFSTAFPFCTNRGATFCQLLLLIPNFV